MADQTSPRREVFSTRIAFLLAAIGSAVGLGTAAARSLFLI